MLRATGSAGGVSAGASLRRKRSVSAASAAKSESADGESLSEKPEGAECFGRFVGDLPPKWSLVGTKDPRESPKTLKEPKDSKEGLGPFLAGRPVRISD